jgi:hypothetical protein
VKASSSNASSVIRRPIRPHAPNIPILRATP